MGIYTKAIGPWEVRTLYWSDHKKKLLLLFVFLKNKVKINV